MTVCAMYYVHYVHYVHYVSSLSYQSCGSQKKNNNILPRVVHTCMRTYANMSKLQYIDQCFNIVFDKYDSNRFERTPI